MVSEPFEPEWTVDDVAKSSQRRGMPARMLNLARRWITSSITVFPS